MYKLGPVHQGILERGSKTGSFAYLLLPSHVGAFSVVMGKHLANFNTEDFPFSYIAEEKGRSELTPAMNIFTVGTRRDSEKWPNRDRRKDPNKLDLIHFDLFSPYIVGRMVNAISLLDHYIETTEKTKDFINHKGINIHRLLLKTSKKYYEMGLKVYLGQELYKKISGIKAGISLNEVRKALTPKDSAGKDRWVEVCGMFSPANCIEALMDEVKSGKINSIETLTSALEAIYKNYDLYAWSWCADLIGKQTGASIENITRESLVQIITDWKANAVKLNNMIMKDAEKEFDDSSKLGFGIDGDNATRDLDFKAVRGAYQDNKFVAGLKKESEEIERKADGLIEVLGKL
jgi:hypothetical protein